MVDVLFINPGNASGSYQDLSKTFSAIETPTWALLLAESCRSIGNTVSILDINAEKLNLTEVLKRINHINPKIICFVVYGQNVNAGTTSMSGAVLVIKLFKSS